MWAALGKSILKGGAKKIATDKFMGRGKKKSQTQGSQEKGGALVATDSSAIVATPTTSLMP